MSETTTTQPADDATTTPEDTAGAENTTEPGESTGEPDGGPEDASGDDAATAKLRREAAKHRTRAKELAEQVETLTARLAATDADTLARALAATGLSVKAFTAAGPELDELRNAETGVLDVAQIAAAAEQVRRDLGVGVPRPNPQQGSPSQAPRRGDLTDAFAHPHRR